MSLTDEEIQQFKKKLEQEKSELESDLETVGRINPDNPKDWEAVQDKLNILNTDENEVADTIEDFEENTAILKELETRYNEVKLALSKIEEGNYGVCEVSGEPIQKERLEINPAARAKVEKVNELEPIRA